MLATVMEPPPTKVICQRVLFELLTISNEAPATVFQSPPLNGTDVTVAGFRFTLEVAGNHCNVAVGVGRSLHRPNVT